MVVLGLLLTMVPARFPAAVAAATDATGRYALRMPAGVRDEFNTANGPEAASPSAGLLKAIANNNVTGFDDPSLDKVMAHTYILPQGN